jgi:hypothetical protein
MNTIREGALRIDQGMKCIDDLRLIKFDSAYLYNLVGLIPKACCFKIQRDVSLIHM